MDNQKIVVVTGGNRGIGLEICRQLATLGWKVFLTARDINKGQKSLEALAEENLDVSFLPLDVSDSDSIKAFAHRLSRSINHLDVLINNAAIFEDRTSGIIDVKDDSLRKTLDTNLLGPILLTQQLLPLLKKSDDARVVNISSGLGALNEMSGGYPSYRISKAALNAASAIFAAELSETSVKVNSMCPGWVNTDMGGSGASRSVEKGAETAVWLATAKTIPNGKFLRDKKVIDW